MIWGYDGLAAEFNVQDWRTAKKMVSRLRYPIIRMSGGRVCISRAAFQMHTAKLHEKVKDTIRGE